MRCIVVVVIIQFDFPLTISWKFYTFSSLIFFFILFFCFFFISARKDIRFKPKGTCQSEWKLPGISWQSVTHRIYSTFKTAIYIYRYISRYTERGIYISTSINLDYSKCSLPIEHSFSIYIYIYVCVCVCVYVFVCDGI